MILEDVMKMCEKAWVAYRLYKETPYEEKHFIMTTFRPCWAFSSQCSYSKNRPIYKDGESRGGDGVG